MQIDPAAMLALLSDLTQRVAAQEQQNVALATENQQLRDALAESAPKDASCDCP